MPGQTSLWLLLHLLLAPLLIKLITRAFGRNNGDVKSGCEDTQSYLILLGFTGGSLA